MAVLEQGRPLVTHRPVVRVDNALAPGRHRFALVVVDAQGRESVADVHVVTVRQPHHGHGHGPGRPEP